jgi:hypothetical protein
VNDTPFPEGFGKSAPSIDPKSHSDPALADLTHDRRSGSLSGSDAVAERMTWLPAVANTFRAVVNVGNLFGVATGLNGFACPCPKLSLPRPSNAT